MRLTETMEYPLYLRCHCVAFYGAQSQMVVQSVRSRADIASEVSFASSLASHWFVHLKMSFAFAPNFSVGEGASTAPSARVCRQTRTRTAERRLAANLAFLCK